MLAMNKRSIHILVAVMLLAAVRPAEAIPAFARKYGLPCSACHQAWPMLNNFGQTFKDNGYQLGNDRDAPISQQPAYWPIMFRVRPEWHRENNNHVPIDNIPGNASSGRTEASLTTSGFNTTAIDLVAAGTLAKNISFFVQDFIGDGGTTLYQSFIRLDNLLRSHWLNLKVGKFDLDMPISQERILTQSLDGSSYYNFFFRPPGSSNVFRGIGIPQLGAEIMGHSANDYSRYSLAVLSSTNGHAGTLTNQSYDLYANFNQSFEVPGLGLQRVGVFGYVGQSPTYFQTSGGVPIPGAGLGYRSFYRAGAYGQWYAGKFDFMTLYMHGQDDVFIGNSVPANQSSSLPAGAVGPSWNGGFVEAHYTQNPRLILVGRYELARMSRQANPKIPSNLGNLDSWTVGYRWYPIMSSRAGLAWTQEYSRLLQAGASPLSGRDDGSSSFSMGFDFDF